MVVGVGRCWANDVIGLLVSSNGERVIGFASLAYRFPVNDVLMLHRFFWIVGGLVGTLLLLVAVVALLVDSLCVVVVELAPLVA